MITDPPLVRRRPGEDHAVRAVGGRSVSVHPAAVAAHLRYFLAIGFSLRSGSQASSTRASCSPAAPSPSSRSRKWSSRRAGGLELSSLILIFRETSEPEQAKRDGEVITGEMNGKSCRCRKLATKLACYHANSTAATVACMQTRSIDDVLRAVEKVVRTGAFHNCARQKKMFGLFRKKVFRARAATTRTSRSTARASTATSCRGR